MSSRADTLIYSKGVDKSLLFDGLTFPVNLIQDFREMFGDFAIGDRRTVTIELQGIRYPVTIINPAFDRVKFAGHAEMPQMRYSRNSEFPKALRTIFSQSANAIATEMERK